MSNNLKLDINHDITISNDRVDRVEGLNYIAQLVKSRLLTFLGEWELNLKVGIDWFNILGRNYDLAIIQGIVTQKILDTDGVSSVENVSIVKNGRALTITFTAIGNGEVFTDGVSI